MTAPSYSDFGVTVYAGDCLDVLAGLPDASVHAVTTDPPYELAFMGRRWDSTGVAFNVEVWRECLRVLKPGGHLLAFGGSRTWHRLTCAVEDAGFEIRDSIAWLYASGFPKSLDVSKAIDKARDDRADIIRVTGFVRDARKTSGRTIAEIDAAFGTNGMAWRWSTTKESPVVPRWEQWLQLKDLLGFGNEMDAEVWRLNGRKGAPGHERKDRVTASVDRTVYGAGHDVVAPGAPVLDDARRWQGWGTALKPAFEPIVVGRKPFAGTVAANVLEHHTGALNIDGCRIASEVLPSDRRTSVAPSGAMKDTYGGGWKPGRPRQEEWGGRHNPAGRWPSNVVLTHAPLLGSETGEAVGDACAEGCVDGCPVRELDEQSGIRPAANSKSGLEPAAASFSGEVYGTAIRNGVAFAGYGDTGGASRFFPVFRFEAKAPASERPRVDGVAHPTVKPLALMRWLVRLVTPPDGVVLDPFLGSGTTAQAARAEGFRCIGIERDESYLPLIKARLGGTTPDLFGGAA